MDIYDFKRETFDKAMVLLINRPSLEFLGILSYGTRIRISDPDEYKMIEPNMSLAHTNGNYIYLMASPKLSPKHLAFVIAHEVWHILSFHPSRVGTRDKVLWNLCCDHVTNRVLKKYVDMGTLEFPHDIVYFEEIEKKYSGITVEDLYDLMSKKWEDEYTVEVLIISSQDDQEQDCPMPDQNGSQSEKEEQDSFSDGSGCKSSPQNQQEKQQPTIDGSPGDSQEQGSKGTMEGKKYAKVTEKKTKKSYIFPLDCDPEDIPKKVEESCKKLAQQAKFMWNSGTISKGNMPDNLVQELDELLKVELPWNEIFERALLYHAQNMERRTWTVRDMYLRNRVLPGKLTGVDTQIAGFWVDSSGSIGDSDLKKFIGICCDSANYFDKILIGIHDYSIHQIHEFMNRPTTEEVWEAIRKVKGRGGTSHREVFDYIAELHEDELLSIMVFQTDFYSDVEGIYIDYPWFKEIPTIWILNNNNKYDFGETFDYKYIFIPGGNS